MPRFHATVDGLVPFTPEEEAEMNAEQAAWAAGKNDRLAADARKKRNELLSESDWMVTKALELNTSLNTSWVTYRQQLRDISSQDGFPQDIVWPTPPG